jgi:hypothetical protein
VKVVICGNAGGPNKERNTTHNSGTDSVRRVYLGSDTQTERYNRKKAAA